MQERTEADPVDEVELSLGQVLGLLNHSVEGSAAARVVDQLEERGRPHEGAEIEVGIGAREADVDVERRRHRLPESAPARRECPAVLNG